MTLALTATSNADSLLANAYDTTETANSPRGVRFRAAQLREAFKAAITHPELLGVATKVAKTAGRAAIVGAGLVDFDKNTDKMSVNTRGAALAVEEPEAAFALGAEAALQAGGRALFNRETGRSLANVARDAVTAFKNFSPIANTNPEGMQPMASEPMPGSEQPPVATPTSTERLQ